MCGQSGFPAFLSAAGRTRRGELIAQLSFHLVWARHRCGQGQRPRV